MDHSKYYTPVNIATILMNMINIDHPRNIIDICCGSCNLLNSAKKKWNSAVLWGVDLLQHENINDVQIVNQDGREFALNCNKNFDLVLANPPFERIRNKSRYSKLYGEEFFGYSTNRLENEMLIANLKILDDKGVLLIILPSTFVEGQTNIKIRKIIGEKYYVKKIIKLPKEIFGSPYISSYALVINNLNQQRKETRLYSIKNIEGKYKEQYCGIIRQNNVATGDWVNTTYSSGELLLCRRGRISTSEFSDAGFPVLHTQKKKDKWIPSIKYIKSFGKCNVYAENKDILISRVGKSAGCWMKYYGEKMLISDCLIKIKDEDDLIFKKIKNKTLFHLIKGVVTQYIAIADIKSWYFSLENI